MRLVTVHLLLLVSAIAVCAQTVATGTVAGKVTSGGKGVSRCTVTVWKQPFNSPDGVGAVTVKTDGEGNYRVPLAAGSYYASVEGGGFYEIENDAVAQQLRTITILEGEVAKLDFEVVRGGVITGKITNPDNAAVVEIPVALVPVDNKPAPGLSQRSTDATKGRTDDRGIYRLFGITPGRYRLTVGESFGAYAGGRSGVAYRRTFYPGTFAEAKATIIEVKPGTMLSDFDLKLAPPERLFSIRGKVVDEETGLPVADIACAVFSFVAGQHAGGLSGMNFTNKRGEFTIDNVPVGRYSISVPSMLVVNNRPMPNYFGDSAQFDVVDQDVTDIIVKASRAATVSGVVALEGEVDKKLLPQLQNVLFTVVSSPFQPGPISAKSFTVGPDSTFFVEGLRPGKLSIGPNATGGVESNPFRMIRTELLGVPQKEPVELKAGAQITDLKLVLVYAPGGLRGAVKLLSGPLPANLRGTVMLYRDKESVAWSIVDGQGNFLLQNLPAGVYRMVTNVQLPGPPPATAHSEQTIEINDQMADAVVVLDPKPTP